MLLEAEFFHLDSKFRAILVFNFVQINSLHCRSFLSEENGNNLKSIISLGGKIMLSMRKVDRIRSLYYDEGMTMTDVARRLNCSVNTVSKYVKATDWSPKPRVARHDYNYKILPYEEDMKTLLQKERNGHHKQRITGKRIFELLKELHPDFSCSYYLTKKHFLKVRQEFYSLNRQYVPLTHNPAKAQVDFAEFFYLHKGEKMHGYLLAVAFPYSNAVYCQAYRGKSGECMLRIKRHFCLY